MSEMEPAETIEATVGAPRDPWLHFGRAVSAEQRVYVLHSDECREIYADLRDCPFSKALDRGIDVEEWEGFEDVPVRLRVSAASMRLMPERLEPYCTDCDLTDACKGNECRFWQPVWDKPAESALPIVVIGDTTTTPDGHYDHLTGTFTPWAEFEADEEE